MRNVYQGLPVTEKHCQMDESHTSVTVEFIPDHAMREALEAPQMSDGPIHFVGVAAKGKNRVKTMARRMKSLNLFVTRDLPTAKTICASLIKGIA
ncbi:hypothetical protein AVEN_76602-1 [Araneus ventricosus]|uniref:Uncharacterized protein n=1 Tax=Araneus ventricosus TaxID=182803 RepID=A0A4Y2KF56_ARAVE|nr:hypothetical protein AVEN_76602-1 [Araneus ventricosus]